MNTASSSTGAILSERRGRALWITINREERRNAINPDVIAGIHAAVSAAANDKHLRAIVLTGAGRKAFCAGADLNRGPGVFADDLSEPSTDFGRLARTFREIGLPSIARINGDCVAGGMGLMALCDLAIVADHARFGLPEAKVGVFPMQVLVFLRHMIHPRHVNELCLTGELISAVRAQDMGIANQVVPYEALDDSVNAWLARLYGMSPTALKRGKSVIAAMESMAFQEALSFAEAQIALASRSEDAREGMAAFNEKRKPRWAEPGEPGMKPPHIVRIGGASGAWGDSPTAIGQLLRGDVHYLMMDYLAEVSMSLLARARMKSAETGYPIDFLSYLKPHLIDMESRRIKVVSNAGGVNPRACKKALEAICIDLKLPLRIAVVEGDDLMPVVEALRAEGVREWVSGEPIPNRLLTANAYLGALPIAAALKKGADIVITGRCADSALALGILMHEFGWKADDYDRLAAGSLVGHLLECGPQATGGIFTDWESVPEWHKIGYPLAECEADGSFTLTKPEGSGGLVTPAAAAEQVLYEIGDPAAYLLPDVVADFSQVRIEQAGPDRVKISGARGRPPTAHYKVSATWQDGYRAVAMACIIGVDAARKAERTAALWWSARAACLHRTNFVISRRCTSKCWVLKRPMAPNHGHAPHARWCCAWWSTMRTRAHSICLRASSAPQA